MDYRKTAQEIYDHIGKKENIISAAHCATRLRLVISDNSKADKEYVENIEGVKGVFFAQGQMQIILGTLGQKEFEGICRRRGAVCLCRVSRQFAPDCENNRSRLPACHKRCVLRKPQRPAPVGKRLNKDA